MIISKTPVRISFFGGGTDYPAYFHHEPGAVISTTIDKYVYITVNRITGLLGEKYRISYSKQELCNDVNDIEHPVVRAVIQHIGITDGLDINIFSDLPSRTGLGSSSSFTVGLLHCLYALQGKIKSKKDLAEEAIHIEYHVLNERVGVQDQLAAAYGGMNLMQFSKEALIVNPVVVSAERKKNLQDHLLLCYTGVNRFASEVLKEQVKKTEDKVNTNDLHSIYQMVEKGIGILSDEQTSIHAFGELLHEAWQTKRKLSSAISSSHLDDIYQKAMNAGALGGKLLGAGGGGFFLFFVEPNKRNAVQESLMPLQLIDFSFEYEGSRIIHIS